MSFRDSSFLTHTHTKRPLTVQHKAGGLFLILVSLRYTQVGVADDRTLLMASYR